MARLSSSVSTRPRSERARRRVFFCAESLESRQLLSVAALHPAIAPVGNVPAAVGPLVPSSAGTLGTAGSASAASSGIQAALEINLVVTGQGSSHGFTETIFIFEEPSVSVLGVTAPTATGNATTPTETGGISTTMNSSGTSSTPAITPLTATILAGPSAGNRSAVAIVILPQTLATNLSPSTTPVTTQAILATATLEEQPIQPPVLGQGFESGQTQGSELQPDKGLLAPKTPIPFEPQLPAVDFIEPYRPEPVNPPAIEPAEPVGPPAPVRNADPVETVPVDPAMPTELSRSPEFPILSPAAESRTEAETPSWSMAAMVGTAAIAGGGYHLVLGGSNRFNQRWFPSRRSSKKNRERKPTLV